jgi:hypothetical protein
VRPGSVVYKQSRELVDRVCKFGYCLVIQDDHLPRWCGAETAPPRRRGPGPRSYISFKYYLRRPVPTNSVSSPSCDNCWLHIFMLIGSFLCLLCYYFRDRITATVASYLSISPTSYLSISPLNPKTQSGRILPWNLCKREIRVHRGALF